MGDSGAEEVREGRREEALCVEKCASESVERPKGLGESLTFFLSPSLKCILFSSCCFRKTQEECFLVVEADTGGSLSADISRRRTSG